MPIPNLIQPAPVVVQPLDKAATKYNTKTRAPVKVIKRKASVTFNAQIQYNKTQDSDPSSGGLTSTSTGYFIATAEDLGDLSYEPKLGDKIITLGGNTGLSLYITETSDTAWYDGEPSLKVVQFSDRRPSRGGA